MSITRRHLLGAGGLALLGGGIGGPSSLAASPDYRALVVVFLNGGNDGSNSLIPVDAGYADYERSRQNLTLPKDSLVSLPGVVNERRFAVHPALRPLAALYERRRLGFIANVGPLVEPSTAAKIQSGEVSAPPFLLSHSDQVALVQGWVVTGEGINGWAGRALELLPSDLRGRMQAVTFNTNRTLVLGRHSPVSFIDRTGASWWGIGDLSRPHELGAQTLARMANWQFANDFEAEYARTYGRAYSDGVFLTQARAKAVAPSADFGTPDGVGGDLRTLASLLPVFRSEGLKRQVFLVDWGTFDTHAGQRGSGLLTQDTQLDQLAKALAAFDSTNMANGLDDSVVTLVMSEFGRTVRPGSGGGSEHGWGNHWWVMGGPVAGGTVVGTFPSLVLGGPDDGDLGNGRLVPSISSDQVGATLMQWMGLDPGAFVDVFPALANFPIKTLPLLRG